MYVCLAVGSWPHTMHINIRGETHRVALQSSLNSAKFPVSSGRHSLSVYSGGRAHHPCNSLGQTESDDRTVSWIWTNALLYVHAANTCKFSAHSMYLGATNSLRQVSGTCCLKLCAAVRWKAYSMIINWSSRFVSDHLPTSVGGFQVRTENSWSWGRQINKHSSSYNRRQSVWR
jgi:hypothetical protein